MAFSFMKNTELPGSSCDKIKDLSNFLSTGGNNS